jgi:adenosylcobinamide kinase/adenosylcobinamide-phosphate guanylyltransferase
MPIPAASAAPPRLTLVLGGARSGKSRYAEDLLTAVPGPWTYVATAQSFDDEMADRIRIHRQRRPAGWETIDAPLDLGSAIAKVASGGRPVLVDCLTLWLSNVMLSGRNAADTCRALVEVLAQVQGPVVAVSNEVGFGIVPDNALARDFRDAQGRLNQDVARIADRVVLVAAGLPLVLK